MLVVWVLSESEVKCFVNHYRSVVKHKTNEPLHLSHDGPQSVNFLIPLSMPYLIASKTPPLRDADGHLYGKHAASLMYTSEEDGS